MREVSMSCYAPSLSTNFESAVGDAPVPVLVKDDSRTYIYANRAAEALLGYGPGTILGRQILDVLDEDRQLMAERWDDLRRLGTWAGYISFRRGDGAALPTRVNAFALDSVTAGQTYTFLVHADRFADKARAVIPTTRNNLTSSEIRLVQLLSEDFSYGEVATILGIGEQAIATALAAIFKKMNAWSRTEVCIRCIKAGIIV
jgi:PAS domain S-box-containing protein